MAPRCLNWRFIGLTYLCLLIFTCPFSICSSFLLVWYLAFLAIDWSRTVSASLLLIYISLVCPRPLLTPYLSFAALCFRRDHFNSDLLCLFFVLVFLRTSVGGAPPFCPYLWPLLLCPPCFYFGSVFGLPFLSPFSLASFGSSFPSGVVPGLSGRRLVQDFQHRPHFPPLFGLLRCFPSAPFPFVTPLLNKCPSVVLLAADWSGVSLRWSPNTPPTRHCLWP